MAKNENVLCPNCKGPATARRDIQHGKDYIVCEDCGPFEVQADGGCVPCDDPRPTDQPEQEDIQKTTSAPLNGADSALGGQDQGPKSAPGPHLAESDSDDDDDSIGLEVTFDDDDDDDDEE